MPELIVIFLAVMLTDILLLDLFNTFGLPTSTTVSIVFELLGAAVAVSVIKITQTDAGMHALADYINTGKALAIISGILLSVCVAFASGALAQFATRMVFTFKYEDLLLDADDMMFKIYKHCGVKPDINFRKKMRGIQNKKYQKIDPSRAFAYREQNINWDYDLANVIEIVNEIDGVKYEL